MSQMLNPHAGNDSTDLEFAELISRIAEQQEAGKSINWEKLMSEHPVFADQVKQVRPAFEGLNQLRNDLNTQGASTGSQNTGPVAGQPLGDFRLLRELGRGGMGVVYEAQQLSIVRKVAVKILPLAALIDERGLRRFRNEVSAIATLNHPNIVSVYSVGEDRGVHYYAMELVRGQSLAAVITELRSQATRHLPIKETSLTQVVPLLQQRSDSNGQPTRELRDGDASSPAEQETRARGRSRTVASKADASYFRAVAKMIIQVAEALQHAHELGVVHRDIKPGNLLLDKNGKIFVTDFGLARIDSVPGVTMTGDILGTLQYMSPEQVLANRVVIDHRTDIYSLGATLYELLTLQALWTSDNRGELVRLISFEEPERPRKLSPSIPVDLETIVLKAIRKHPQERYQAAQELADDLNSFLEHKPIQARPTTLLQHATKWVGRHKEIAATFVGALLFAFIGLSFSNWLIATERNKARDERTLAQQQKEEAEQQKLRADENFRRAQEAVDKYLTKVSEEELLDAPGMQPLRKELLQLALGYYQELIDERADEVQLTAELAAAYQRVAKIETDLGGFGEPIVEKYRKALEIRQQLAEKYPQSADFQFELAMACFEFSRFGEFSDAGFSESKQLLEKAIRIATEWTDGNTRQLEFRVLHVRCVRQMGMVLYNKIQSSNESDYQAAIDTQQNAIDLCAQYRSENPESTELVSQASSNSLNLGVLYQRNQENEKAFEAYRKSVDLHRIDLEQNPDSIRHKSSLARALMHLPDLEAIVEAVEIQEELVRENPAVTSYQHYLCSMLINLSATFGYEGDFAKEIECLQRALKVRKKLVEFDPTAMGWQSNLANIYNRLHSAQWKNGELDAAYESSREAVKIVESIEKNHDIHVTVTQMIYSAYLSHGWFNFDAKNEYREAMRWWGKAEITQRRIAKDKLNLLDRYLVALYPFRFGRVDLALGQNEMALEFFQECLSTLLELIAEDSGQTDVQVTIARCFARIGDANIGLGRIEQARESYELAIKKWEELAVPECTDALVYSRLAILLADCGIVELRDPAKALEMAKAAKELLTDESHPTERRIVNKAMGIAMYRTGQFRESIEPWIEYAKLKEHAERLFFLSMAQFKTGNEAEAKTNFEKGIEWMAEHENQHPSLLRLQKDAAELLETKNEDSGQSATD